MVVADSEPGQFDEHGRRLMKPALSDIFGGPASRSATSFAFGKGKAGERQKQKAESPLPDIRHPTSDIQHSTSSPEALSYRAAFLGMAGGFGGLAALCLAAAALFARIDATRQIFTRN